MVKIVRLYRGFEIVRWLCPHHIDAAVSAGWDPKEWRRGAYPIDCDDRDLGGCTSAWVEPPPYVKAAEPPAQEAPALEHEPTAGEEHRAPVVVTPKKSHPVTRDRRLKRLLELRAAGMPLAAALEQVEKETTP